MSGLDHYERLFVSTAFSIQIVLLVFFALRKWKFDTAMQIGWIVFALAVPAVIVSLELLVGDNGCLAKWCYAQLNLTRSTHMSYRLECLKNDNITG